MAATVRSVLVVEDEGHVCEAIRVGLESMGLGFACVGDPLEALRLLSRRRFDLILADMAMPSVSGLELLAYTRSNSPDTRVILMSSVGDVETLAAAISMGAYDYLRKPFDERQLERVVARAIGGDPCRSNLPLRAAKALHVEPQLRQVSLESIRALVLAVEAKDPHTRKHSEHVAFYAMQLAEALGLDEDLIVSIRTASILHDCGKIGIPDDVLTKAGPLTDRQRSAVRKHPTIGFNILGNISAFAAEADFVRAHHEAWDGSGYPRGLRGQEIPLGARVVNVADSMDAMLMKRTYKAPYPLSKVIDELERCSGTQFDPDIASAAMSWCRNNPERIILSDKAFRAAA